MLGVAINSLYNALFLKNYIHREQKLAFLKAFSCFLIFSFLSKYVMGRPGENAYISVFDLKIINDN